MSEQDLWERSKTLLYFYDPDKSLPNYNLINNFSIIACGARRARSFATAYLLTGAQHTLRAGIFRDDR